MLVAALVITVLWAAAVLLAAGLCLAAAQGDGPGLAAFSGSRRRRRTASRSRGAAMRSSHPFRHAA